MHCNSKIVFNLKTIMNAILSSPSAQRLVPPPLVRQLGNSAGRERVQGAQSLRRALMLLSDVARAGEAGIRLAELVRSTGLDRATAYRMLTCMVEEQFVDRDDDNRYRLGPLAVLMGSLLPAPTPLLARFVPVMKRIARISGETVYFILRRGDHAHCTHREAGECAERVLISRSGQERLLGTSTGGCAILGLLAPEDVAALHARHRDAYLAQGLDAAALALQAETVARQGFAVSHDTLEPGVSGLGIAFRISGHGMAAMSINSWTHRLGPLQQERARELIASELVSLGML